MNCLKNVDYWAGFIAADGCISVVKNKYKYLYVTTKISDKKHLKKLKILTKGSFYNLADHCIFYSSNKYLIKILETIYSVTPKKSLTLQPPKLKNIHKICKYIIGYIDGDGCIRITNTRGYKYISLEICGNKDLLLWIKDIFDQLYPVYNRQSNVHKVKNKNCYKYNLTGKRAYGILKILKSYNVPKMGRKWNKIKLEKK